MRTKLGISLETKGTGYMIFVLFVVKKDTKLVQSFHLLVRYNITVSKMFVIFISHLSSG